MKMRKKLNMIWMINSNPEIYFILFIKLIYSLLTDHLYNTHSSF